MQMVKQKGFTLVELLIVVVILGLLSAIMLPKYWEIARQARIATLEGFVSNMRSAIAIVRTKALAEGLRVASSNPGGGGSQDIYLVQVEGLQTEVDWRNLCPESDPERGDALGNNVISMLDYIYLQPNKNTPLNEKDKNIKTLVNNRYTFIGFDIRESGPGGCYVKYDSFGDPMCTIDMVFDDC